jgi:DNA-binding XRE family transcriptional regulator
MPMGMTMRADSTVDGPYTESAEFIRNARTKLNLTQIQFAQQLGLERRSIMRFERGHLLPRPVELAVKHLLTEQKKNKARSKARRQVHHANQ